MKVTIQFKNKEFIQGLNLEEEQITSLFTNDVTVINTDELKFFVPKQNINFIMAEKEEEKKNVD
jgi:hypothetical protein